MKSDPVDSPPECGGDGRDDEQPTRVTDVEFVVNCFERNIDAVTTPGTLAALSGQHVFGFRIRTLLINNVTDRERAESLAEGAVERGEIDRYAFVDQWADRAFRATRLEPGDFGPFLHWSDCVLAALALEGPEFLCYQDVDTRLLDPADWITHALKIMEDDRRIAVANPLWVMPDGSAPVHAEADERGDGFILGYGFSDMVFLARRTQLLQPMVRRGIPLWIDCPATLRFPAAALGVVFEQVVEGFLRRKHLMRLTILNAAFTPVAISSYPPRSLTERFKVKRNSAITETLVRSRRQFPWLLTSPRLRFTGLLDPEFSNGPGSPRKRSFS